MGIECLDQLCEVSERAGQPIDLIDDDHVDLDGKTYDGQHEALVSNELWERVQDVLEGRVRRQGEDSKARFCLLRSDQM